MSSDQTICIIGGGSWGAAIADRLQQAGHQVRLLVRRAQTAEALAQSRVDQLPDTKLSQPLVATTDPAILAEADVIYIVVPIAAHPEIWAHIRAHARKDVMLVFASKGLMQDADKGGLFLPEWLSGQNAKHPFVIVSGPSFADEVIAGKPAALVAASHDLADADKIANQFKATSLRVYSSPDPLGVAIGGAVKNVIAIAAGIATGLGLGDNARAAVVTRGLAEMQRLARHLQAQSQTLSGLSGIGDLMLSCAGPHSRNMAYGLALGSGAAVPDRLTEGQLATARLMARASYEGVDMPVTRSVDQVINHQQDLQTALANLLKRDVGLE